MNDGIYCRDLLWGDTPGKSQKYVCLSIMSGTHVRNTVETKVCVSRALNRRLKRSVTGRFRELTSTRLGVAGRVVVERPALDAWPIGGHVADRVPRAASA